MPPAVPADSHPKPPGGARLMFGFEGTRVTRELVDRLTRTGARGVILFARNVVDASQTAALIAELRRSVPWPLLVAVDQEGGSVVRLTRGASVFPGNMALGAAGSPELAFEQGRESGRQLAALGFDLNLAPVVDLQTNAENPGIGIRSLGASVDDASPLAEALVAGHAAAGVTSCLKHFPGKGAARVDAHRALPVIDLALEAFRRPHLEIFERLCPRFAPLAVMTSHVVMTGLDPDAPATLSDFVVREVLRQRIGFGGLTVTDDLEMGAILSHWGVAQAAERAAAAGHDLILVCHTPDRQVEAAERLQEALEQGRLDSEEHARAIARIEAISGGPHAADPVDPAPGDRLAQAIADRCVHVFADPKQHLPLSADQHIVGLLVRPHSIVGVEETSGSRFEKVVEAALRQAGLTGAQVLGVDGGAASDPPCALPEALCAADRALLFTWDARGQAWMRDLLDRACRKLGDRLIVVHLRNPFDQALVPAGLTALTAFGYQRCQIRALADVLAGRRQAMGKLPAPVEAR